MKSTSTKCTFNMDCNLLSRLFEYAESKGLSSTDDLVNEAVEYFLALKESQVYERLIQEAAKDEAFLRRTLETDSLYFQSETNLLD